MGLNNPGTESDSASNAVQHNAFYNGCVYLFKIVALGIAATAAVNGGATYFVNNFTSGDIGSSVRRAAMDGLASRTFGRVNMATGIVLIDRLSYSWLPFPESRIRYFSRDGRTADAIEERRPGQKEPLILCSGVDRALNPEKFAQADLEMRRQITRLGLPLPAYTNLALAR
mgnify:CR=1 FL=1